MGGAGSSGLEREVKMGAWAGVTVPDLEGVLPGVTTLALPSLRLTATYYDTADLRLARWGVTVRHRSGDVEGELPWTVKLPEESTGGALARREIGFAGSEGRVPAGVAHLVRGMVRSAPLVPAARLRTDRLRLELRSEDGRSAAELDDDEVSVLVGRRLAARFRELEVELAPGADPAILDAVVARLRAAGAGAPDPTPKVVRALGPRALEPPDVAPQPLGRRATVGDAVHNAVATSVARLIRHDPGVRLGDDPEDVHQARVATRRLRSDLRTFATLVDDHWSQGLRDELGWIAGLLGAVRDTDVLLERLRVHAGELPDVDTKAVTALLRRLEDQREGARESLLAAMDSQRYVDLLDRAVEAAASPVFARSGAADRSRIARPPVEPAAPVSPRPEADRHHGPLGDAGGRDEDELAPVDLPPGVMAGEAAFSSRPSPSAPGGDAPARPAPVDGPEDAPAAQVLPALVRGPWRRLHRAVAALGPEPEDDALHQIRIHAKRCRYAAEAAAPVIGKPASNLAAAVAELQGVLGDFHDAIVAEGWLRQIASRSSAGAALVAGELITFQRQEAAECRAAWMAEWKAASAKKLRAWLDAR